MRACKRIGGLCLLQVVASFKWVPVKQLGVGASCKWVLAKIKELVLHVNKQGVYKEGVGARKIHKGVFVSCLWVPTKKTNLVLSKSGCS